MNSIKEKISKINYREEIKSLVIIIFLALSFRSFVIEPHSIPSGSMRPNLLEGDYLFSYKFSYGFSRYSIPFGLNLFDGRIFKKDPQRGDIVIFRGKDGRTYIKRLIGLPGERVQLINHEVHINGNKLSRVYTGKYDEYQMCSPNALMCNKYTETLPNGVSYTILQASNDDKPEFTMTTQEYYIPSGHYFMLGDNRNNSIDSRYLEGDVSLVPEQNLIAQAKYLVLTFDFEKLFEGRLFKAL